MHNKKEKNKKENGTDAGIIDKEFIFNGTSIATEERVNRVRYAGDFDIKYKFILGSLVSRATNRYLGPWYVRP